MSKRLRNKFERQKHYATPLASVKPLVPHLRAAKVAMFDEPCCGAGALRDHLQGFGFQCGYQGDIDSGMDAHDVARFDNPVITNPEFDPKVLLPLLAHFLRTAPSTWLLLTADFAHLGYARPFLVHCTDIIVCGRARWFGDKPGFENVAWYRFDRDHRFGARFHNGSPLGGITCSACGKTFVPSRPDARYCSGACKQRSYRSRNTSVTGTSL